MWLLLGFALMLPRGEDYVLLGGALTSNKNSSGHGILRQFWQKLSSTFRLQLYPICTEMPDFCVRLICPKLF